MKFLCLLLPLLSLLAATHTASAANQRPPNVLFIIADDASRNLGQAYGCDWIKTPNIDRLAMAGIVFDNAYTPTSKCGPSRAAIMTGRNPWLLEDAGNHQPSFPSKFMAFPEALGKLGIPCGASGKTWGPGEALNADGSQRDFGLKGGNKTMGSPAPAFALFLKERTPGKPFFYWFGSKNPHRPYKLGAGSAAGKKTAEIDHVPAYWPDNDEVRGDMLDYATEVEAYDTEIGALLAELDASGEAADTLIIVTSDHGMPFPRVKGHTIDEAHHIPFIASWANGIVKPGRRVAECISLIDLAPTMLELFGADGIAQGMSPIVGRSFAALLRNEPQSGRESVIIGRERNDVSARPGTPSGLGYPVRAIREGSLLYIHNFEPNRWPCGDAELGFLDTDNSPTKSLIEALGPQSEYWQYAFGKRPADQLFDVVSDPDCVKNLAADPAFAARMTAMHSKLTAELTQQNDPRMLGQGAVFDNYHSPKRRLAEAKSKGKKQAKAE